MTRNPSPKFTETRSDGLFGRSERARGNNAVERTRRSLAHLCHQPQASIEEAPGFQEKLAQLKACVQVNGFRWADYVKTLKSGNESEEQIVDVGAFLGSADLSRMIQAGLIIVKRHDEQQKFRAEDRVLTVRTTEGHECSIRIMEGESGNTQLIAHLRQDSYFDR